MLSNRTKIKLFLGIALVFVVEMEERFTGLRNHELLGLAFGVIAILHILLHWNWIVSITKTLFRKVLHESRLNYLLNIALFVDALVMTVTGILISRTLGLNIEIGREWQRIHILSAELSLLIVALHVAMHWKWIATHTKKYLLSGGLEHESRCCHFRSGRGIERNPLTVIPQVAQIVTSGSAVSAEHGGFEGRGGEDGMRWYLIGDVLGHRGGCGSRDGDWTGHRHVH